MNCRLPVLCLVLSHCAPALADNQFTAGASYWGYDAGGTVRYQSNDPADAIDINDDLGYGDGSRGSYYLQLEHMVPLLPNARLSRIGIDESASGRLARSVDFGGSNFIVGEDIDSTVTYQQTDVILYYSVFDTAASIDLGLDAKYIDSEVTLDGAISGRQSASATGWIPALYARVGIELPLTGLGIDAAGSYAGYQGDRLYELNLRASYNSMRHVGVELGYRRVQLDLEDFDGTWADIAFDGPYAGMFLVF